MKKYILSCLIIASILLGCSSKKDEQKTTDKLMFQLDSIDKQTGLQKMQTSTSRQQVSINGNKYDIFINRAPSDSLPTVKCESGQFADNRILVKISSSSNGKTVFQKTFTKSIFNEHLTDDFKKNAILEGVVFDNDKSEKNKRIYLAASVCFPLSDLYIPFSIKIENGSIASISKDENMDDSSEN